MWRVDADTRTPRPWWPTLRSLAVAWIAAAFAVLVLTWPIAALAYDIEMATGEGAPWLMPTDDAWGWVANAPLALFALAVFTGLTRLLLFAEERDEKVALVPLVAVLGVTGAAATLPDEGGAGLLWWFVAAWIVRHLPRVPAAPRRRVRPAVLAAATAGALLLLAVPVAYGIVRPLRVSESVSWGTAEPLRETKAVRVPFSIENAGRRSVEVLDVELEGVPWPVKVGALETLESKAIRWPRTIAPHGSLDIVARPRLVAGGCLALMRGRGEPRLATHIRVRYRVAGRTMAVRLPAGHQLEHGGCTGRDGSRWER